MSPAQRSSPHSLPHPPPHPPSRARPWPWRGLIVAAALVLALHALVLGWLPLGVGVGWSGGVAPRLRVRPIVAVAMPDVAPAAAASSERALSSAGPEPAATPRAVASSRSASPRSAADVASAPAVSAPAADARDEARDRGRNGALEDARDEGRGEPSTAVASSAPPVVANLDGGGQGIPTYATLPPPAVTMQFELRRAGLSGNAELLWRPEQGRYSLQLNGAAFGRPILAWRSDGGFDAFGLAPERFVDRRRSRDVRAANFQRDKGLITYSGPQIEHPLVAGAQDRLSWMLQLPAVVAAQPAAYDIGARISMFVVGARGDADVWSFDVKAREAVDVAEGRVEGALKLVREPRKAYDTGVEVWLDPARHFLPVRLRLLQPQAGEGFEFSLLRLSDQR